MSDNTCPNCGTPMRVSAMWSSWENIRPKHRKAEGLKEPEKYVCPLSTRTCNLIRSLREERDRYAIAAKAGVHALRWLHYHGLTSSFDDKREAAYKLLKDAEALRNSQHRKEPNE